MTLTRHEPTAVFRNELDDPRSYFILEGSVRADIPYPDYYVSMRRLSHADLPTPLNDSWSLSILSELKRRNGVFPHTDTLSPLQTGEGIWGTGIYEGSYPYLANLNPPDFLKLNLYYNSLTLNPSAFVDAVRLIREGLSGNRDVFDGTGKRIYRPVLSTFYDDLLGTENKGARGEFLDAYFLMIHGDLYLATNHVLLPNGNLSPQFIRPLEDLLTQNRSGAVGINFDAYLDTTTSQGFPFATIRGGNCKYWAPRNDSFGSFTVRDGNLELNFGTILPELKSPTIGIRAVKLKR